jgi:rare lipoprotein A
MVAQQFRLVAVLAAALALSATAHAQSFGCEDHFKLDDKDMAPYQYGPITKPPTPAPKPTRDPLDLRALKYAAIALKHRVEGLASYYSTSLDGSLTATGETFRNARFTAAHLTLPLGTWVEVTARATGKTIRCRINDRGPYAKKFVLDLSQSAARALGVDRAEDRHVEIRIVALPGEHPLPVGWDLATSAPVDAAAAAASTAAALAQ